MPSSFDNPSFPLGRPRRFPEARAAAIDEINLQSLTTDFLRYLFQQAKRYNATDLKRFDDHKRYALMICFLLETRKVLLDHLVLMHDQYMLEITRQTKNAHEKKHRELRKRQKKAIDVVLDTTHRLLDWSEPPPLSKEAFWQQVNEIQLRHSLDDLHTFKQLEERGYGPVTT